MLEFDIDVLKGILFIHLDGVLNKETISQFERELNYLLYKQGMHYYVLDFKDIERIEFDVISWLENKLVEIFLSCGKVVLCGLDGKYEKKIGKQDKLFYVREGIEAFKYLTV